MKLIYENVKETTLVRRNDINERKRPNAHKRHDPIDDADIRFSSLHILSEEPLEWLSLNYRKERAVKLSSSMRRMILIMFQKDIPYFPTLREIRDELIQAQVYEL